MVLLALPDHAHVAALTYHDLRPDLLLRLDATEKFDDGAERIDFEFLLRILVELEINIRLWLIRVDAEIFRLEIAVVALQSPIGAIRAPFLRIKFEMS